MELIKELEKLERMHKRGALTDKEFKQAKASLLRKAEPLTHKVEATLNEVSSDRNFWPMLIHFSQLFHFLVPFVGLVVPVVLWQIKKDDSPDIDRHGRAVTNWLISSVIYYVIAALLSWIVIGIPLAIALAGIGLIFPIIGGIKASKGELWEYPGAISFFPVEPVTDLNHVEAAPDERM